MNFRTSLEVAEPYNQDRQTWIYPSLLLLVILLFCYFPCHLTLSASNYYVHYDWAAPAVICRIVSNLSLLAYGRTYFTMICPKRKKVYRSCALSIARLFKKKRCDLRHQPCPGYKLLKKKERKKQTKTNTKKKYLSAKKPARFWKGITSSFSLKKIHWS